jgi:hypothetical protein
MDSCDPNSVKVRLPADNCSSLARYCHSYCEGEPQRSERIDIDVALVISPRLVDSKSLYSGVLPYAGTVEFLSCVVVCGAPFRVVFSMSALPSTPGIAASACDVRKVPGAEICRSDVMEGQRRTNDQISRMCVRNTGRLARSSNVIPQIPRQSPCEQDRQGSLRPFFPSSTPDNFRQCGD